VVKATDDTRGFKIPEWPAERVAKPPLDISKIGEDSHTRIDESDKSKSRSIDLI